MRSTQLLRVDPHHLKRSQNAQGHQTARLGAKKGGKSRMAALTPEERSELGKKAAAARWKKYWQ